MLSKAGHEKSFITSGPGLLLNWAFKRFGLVYRFSVFRIM